MATQCKAEGAPEAIDWLRSASKHGVLPIHRRLAEDGAIKPGDLGTEVEMKCGEVCVTVQLIEARESELANPDVFWATAQHQEQQDAIEMQSERHKRHPCIGYKDVPPRKRPTWEGSDAQAVAEAKDRDEPEDGDADVADGVVLGDSDTAEEAGNDKEGDSDSDDSSSSSSSSSDSDEDAPLISNATRLQVQHAASERSSQRNTKKRPSPPADEPTQEETHHVYAVFGAGDNGQAEVWLGIKVPCRAKESIRMQFLDPISEEPGKYMLLDAAQTYPARLVAHTFKDVVFSKKNVNKSTRSRHGGRGKRKHIIVTKEPLDADVLRDLEAQCAAGEDESEE